MLLGNGVNITIYLIKRVRLKNIQMKIGKNCCKKIIFYKESYSSG